MANPMPDNVRSWTVSDVGRWLDSLSLGQYVAAFTEASVDGPFLLELREEDMVQVRLACLLACLLNYPTILLLNCSARSYIYFPNLMG